MQALLVALCLCCGAQDPLGLAQESSRPIPVAYTADVFVAGGAVGGVSAALAASEAGASVFLAAQEPYLGGDMCGTYRLWLEDGETPEGRLAKALYEAPEPGSALGAGLPFTYEASLSPAGGHRDTNPPSMLSDGKWASASTQSVQYDEEVTLTLDLGAETALGRLHVLAYQRPGDFVVGSIEVYAGDGKGNWEQVAAEDNPASPSESCEQESLRITAPLGISSRYLRVTAHPAPRAKRMLLSEIVIEGPATETQEKPDAMRYPPRPMQIKHVLDQALIEGGVEFLTGSYVTDLIHTADGNIAGVVMANRSGRQAVLAKVIIDATPNASVARMAGAQFSQPMPDRRIFRRIVVGGEAVSDPALTARGLPSPVLVNQPGQAGKTYPAFEYTAELAIADNTYAALEAAEHRFRNLTYHAGQVAASDVLFEIPPVALHCKARQEGPWSGPEAVSLDAFCPLDAPGVYLINGYADVARDDAGTLLRPLVSMKLGERIGREAARAAKTLPPPPSPQDLRLLITEHTLAALPEPGDTREFLDGPRPHWTRCPRSAPRIGCCRFWGATT